jgi:hypothetical protein
MVSYCDLVEIGILQKHESTFIYFINFVDIQVVI